MEIINLDDSQDVNATPNISPGFVNRRKRKKMIRKLRRKNVQATDSFVISSHPTNEILNTSKRKKRSKKKKLSIITIDSDEEESASEEVTKEAAKLNSSVIEISDSDGEGIVSGIIEISNKKLGEKQKKFNLVSEGKWCYSNQNNNNGDIKDFSSLNNVTNTVQSCDNPIIRTHLTPSQENPSTSLMSLETSLNNRRNSTSYQPTIDTRKNETGLRPIIIDGSNVAFGHGRERFSARGIEICIEYFIRRNHKEIRAFLPQFRRRHYATVGIDILDKLETDGYLIYTPSRMVNGKRITSYDDRYIVEYATKTGGIIITRDNYTDLLKENPSWSETINFRLLQYTFVGDMIMFPQDPLGQGGPSLNKFLMY